MICKTCSGLGHFWREIPGGSYDWPDYDQIVCPDCGGHGVVFCCDPPEQRDLAPPPADSPGTAAAPVVE